MSQCWAFCVNHALLINDGLEGKPQPFGELICMCHGMAVESIALHAVA